MIFNEAFNGTVQLAVNVDGCVSLQFNIYSHTVLPQCNFYHFYIVIILISLSSACHPTTLLLLLLPLLQIPCRYQCRIAIQHFILLVLIPMPFLIFGILNFQLNSLNGTVKLQLLIILWVDRSVIFDVINILLNLNNIVCTNLDDKCLAVYCAHVYDIFMLSIWAIINFITYQNCFYME